MILLLIPAWILVLLLVAGVCAVARAGDDQSVSLAFTPEDAPRRESRAWGPAIRREVSTYAEVGPAQPVESEDSPLRRLVAA